MALSLLIFALALITTSPVAAAEAPSMLRFQARAQQELAPGSGKYQSVERDLQWAPARTAIIVCDMWDQHWCIGATARVAELAPRMNEVIQEARRRGVLILHAPSSTMSFYKDYPQRKRAQQAPKASAPANIEAWRSLNQEKEGALPIDDSDGGCDDHPQCPGGNPWRRQIATIEIAPEDYISDSGEEVYNILQKHGIENVIVMGVHTNMCVLGRPFSIRQMVSLGKNVLLMRDMTDTMYNSRMRPFVSHFAGTDLVVRHIERHWCASITSAAFLGGTPFQFVADKRPQIVFLIGEDEYDTRRTLPEFARAELEDRGLNSTFVHADEKDPNRFAGIEAVRNADLLVVSVRRRALPKKDLDLIRQHVANGKAVVGIRTASHAFDTQVPSPDHAVWPTFDVDVLGSHYLGHYGNKPPKDPPTVVRIVPEAATHPVLTGVPPSGFNVTSHLYKYEKHAGTMTPLLTGQVEGKPETQRLAWVYTGNNRRVFYTSLGNQADFELPAFRRLLLNGILWSLNLPVPPEPKAARDSASATPPPPSQSEGPFAPSEAIAQFRILEDLEIQPVLAEPTIKQPVFLNFDERGRLWVVQYLQYPHPAGLKIMSRDNVWRAVYDKVPPPPPNHYRGADKITIHEDTNGDGAFDSHKTFVDGLNIAVAVAQGRGGVWVLNAPYLLFYPDRNQDDVPDSDPEVHLAGFGLEDTHSVVNSLRWGPDGWLYAAQGSTVTANLIRPGIDKEPMFSMGQLIWRYHPETKRYEVFSEGGGNAFGVEIDSKGRVFSGHNGGNTRGFHYMQGAYLQKGFEKHGPLSNPYSFGYFPPMPHPDVERFTHNFLIYDSGALPERYHGKLFGVEPLQGRVVYSEIAAEGSTFKTTDLGHAVTTGDRWFKPVDIKLGPDGAVYIADWYDRQVNHYRNHEGQIDKENGRIYRLQAKGAKPAAVPDLRKLSSAELVELLKHRNRWHRQTALRLLGDRRDISVLPALLAMLRANSPQDALEALWAVHLSGGFSDSVAAEALDHGDPHVRAWTIRLLGDDRRVSSSLAQKLAQVAAREPNVEVRAQLAASARRLPANEALPVVRALLQHSEDLSDKRLPLLLWWAIESKAESDRDAVLAMAREGEFWKLPLVQTHLLEKFIRRYAQAGTRQDLLACARLLQLCPDKASGAKLLAGFELAYKGRSMSGLPDELLEAMARFSGESTLLGLRRGDAKAVGEALKVIRDESADPALRARYIQTLGEVRTAASVAPLMELLKQSKDPVVLKAALTALQSFYNSEIGETVAGIHGALPAPAQTSAFTLLASRPNWALALLNAVADGRIPAASVPQDVRHRIMHYKDDEVARLAGKIWGHTKAPTTAEMQKLIEHSAAIIRTGAGSPYEGQKVYMASCGACHKLFGQGGQIGPDLTMFKRDDLENMLLSIANPSAEIREGFENHLVTTRDGRTLTGFLADKDNRVIVLRGLDGENLILPQDQVAEMKSTGVSLMPEGLLEAFEEQQLRDLFAYLRSTQPLVR
jgi:putative heme-binding domain-containing protein